jgi:hypothetical protein
MPTIPAPILPWIDRQFHDANGAPLVLGKVYSYEAGTSTPKATYADEDLTTPLANPVILDAEGRATIYIAPGGYKFVVTDSEDVELYTIDNVYDVGSTLFATMGEAFTEGAKGEATDYVVLPADTLVTVDGGTVYLEPAADRTFPLFIKNIGASPLIVTPDGSDTIDGLASYSMDAAASPEFPCVMLVSDGVSAWWILASHAC